MTFRAMLAGKMWGLNWAFVLVAVVCLTTVRAQTPGFGYDSAKTQWGLFAPSQIVSVQLYANATSVQVTNEANDVYLLTLVSVRNNSDQDITVSIDGTAISFPLAPGSVSDWYLAAVPLPTGRVRFTVGATTTSVTITSEPGYPNFYTISFNMSAGTPVPMPYNMTYQVDFVCNNVTSKTSEGGILGPMTASDDFQLSFPLPTISTCGAGNKVTLSNVAYHDKEFQWKSITSPTVSPGFVLNSYWNNATLEGDSIQAGAQIYATGNFEDSHFYTAFMASDSPPKPTSVITLLPMGPGLTPEEVAFQVPSPAPKELERASKLYLLAILEGTTEEDLGHPAPSTSTTDPTGWTVKVSSSSGGGGMPWWGTVLIVLGVLLVVALLAGGAAAGYMVYRKRKMAAYDTL